jgi:hypothetical protein
VENNKQLFSKEVWVLEEQFPVQIETFKIYEENLGAFKTRVMNFISMDKASKVLNKVKKQYEE